MKPRSFFVSSSFFLFRSFLYPTLVLCLRFAICLPVPSPVSLLWQGTILLAVNPLKAVPVPPLENFMGQPLDPESPHPYAIAEVHTRRFSASLLIVFFGFRLGRVLVPCAGGSTWGVVHDVCCCCCFLLVVLNGCRWCKTPLSRG